MKRIAYRVWSLTWHPNDAIAILRRVRAAGTSRYGTAFIYINNKQAFAKNWIVPAGSHLEAFEKELSAVTRAPYAVAVASGTAAIHLGLILMDVQPGDEVFVSTLTFAASVSMATLETTFWGCGRYLGPA